MHQQLETSENKECFKLNVNLFQKLKYNFELLYLEMCNECFMIVAPIYIKVLSRINRKVSYRFNVSDQKKLSKLCTSMSLVIHCDGRQSKRYTELFPLCLT